MGLMLAALLLYACDDDDNGDLVGPGQDAVVSASGDLTAALAEFAALLGEPANGGAPGQQPSGRRTIRWDGVPDSLTNNSAFPVNFFQGNGLVYTATGTGLRVSDNNFSDLNPTYAGQFASFRNPKTFMAPGSNQTEFTCRVAGTDSVAAVTGFGVVLSDVDRAGSAYIELYNAAGDLLGRFDAPARSDAAGHSFIGAVFGEPIIARVRITSGDAPLGADQFDLSTQGNRDLVIVDDFLFGEPRPQ